MTCNFHLILAVHQHEFTVPSLASFTADQWHNWTNVFSPFVLKGILAEDHYKCWLLFVEACQIITLRTLKPAHVHRADTCLLLFCKKFEELYGSECCTPNMHLHCHLRDVLLDYGPAYGLWLFSFERYNGLLGNYNTNMKSIEPQIMRKFLLSQFVFDWCSNEDTFDGSIK